jgi:ankyrin repeat protein
MANWLGIRVAVLLLLAGSSVALSQERGPNVVINIVPNTIEFIPLLAKAAMIGDRETIVKQIEKKDNVNERVRAREGARAGFTPLMIAASLPSPDIAKLLIDHGAKITIVDDFGRSAFWYAALRDSFSVSQVLATAPDASDVINVADSDLKRTPLHLAVRGESADLVRLLIDKGASASKEKKDYMGETPVDYCKVSMMTRACKALF